MQSFAVTWLASGHRSLRLSIEASNIFDLEVVPETPQNEEQHMPHRPVTPISQVVADDFPASPLPGPSPARDLSSPTLSSHGGRQAAVDPAILSYTKPLRPRITQPSAVTLELHALNLKGAFDQVSPTISSKPSIPIITKPSQTGSELSSIARQPSLTTATLLEPFNNVSVSDKKESYEVGLQAAELETNGGSNRYLPTRPVGPPAVPVEISSRQNGKRTRRGTKGKGVKNASVQASISTPYQVNTPQSLQDVTQVNRSNNTPSRSKGPSAFVGREASADLVDSPSTLIKSSKNYQEKRPSRRALARAKDAQNGWATEDATDVQEMEPFDFAGNLSKFDKRGVFDQFRKDDTTADESRLIHHNRLPPKPGTAGGKNLHWTENVLELPQSNGYGRWNSEAGESEDGVDDHRLSSGRSSRRNTSRSGFRRPQSRRGSAKVSENQPWVNSKLSAASLGSTRYSSLEQPGSPKPGRNMSASPFTGSVPQARPSLRVFGSNKICPCLSPLQMLELEQFAVSELGLSEDMITENAARGIADTFIDTLRGVKKDQDLQERSPISSCIVAVGNHKTGARAVAAGRHLRNHGYRVIVTIFGLDREEDLLDSVRVQLNAYRKAGGSVLKPSELLEGLKGDTYRPTIIIDALLGIHTCFEDLRREDQAFFFELALWVNRGMIEVLSVDVPSGLDASNGTSRPNYTNTNT